MSGTYKPGWQSRAYHRLPRAERSTISREVDRAFREQTGVTRRLDPTSMKDLDLRRKWLFIRDAVMAKRDEQLDRDMEDMRRDDVLLSIPEEMRWEGWKEAAELLETWFERPPIIAPGYTEPVAHLITMEWVLGFARAKLVYDEIVKDQIWTNAESQVRMVAIMKKRPRAAGQAWGDLSKPATEVDEVSINEAPVHNGLSADALSGALGAFKFKVAIAGKVLSVGTGEFRVSIEEVGVYVRDSFDFSGDQFLGFWGYRDDPINNIDFRQWRANNHAGGDFLVFSDIKRTRLTPPGLVKVRL